MSIEKIPVSSIGAKKQRSLEQDGHQVIGVILVDSKKREDGTYGRVTVDNFGRVQFWDVDGSGRMYASREPIANQADIVQRLRALSDEMAALGTAMEYFGGFSEVAEHGREMMGASLITLGWITEMEKQ
jgi:hypothetical protein